MDCLDDDSVIAFLDGNVDDALRARIESHLAECEACVDLLATSAGGAPETLARQSLSDVLATGASLVPGATIGRYVILNLVGRGGMGEVYAAYDPRLERKVALKLLRDKVGRRTTPRAAQERLLREAQSTARLSHPNIVVVYDAGAIDDEVNGVRVYLAMEFVEGQTLSEWLTAEPRSWRAIRDVFAAAGEGLLAAHEAGLVHRDFKPQNVMVGRDGTVRVMDFGLASDTTGSADAATTLQLVGSSAQPTSQTIALTRTGALLGTPLYMAPEQFLGRPTDARADQFAFCVTLYEAIYAQRPFAADTFEALVEAVVSGRPREPGQKKDVPSFLRRLVLRGLRGDPRARYPSMRELLSALRSDPARRRRVATTATAMATVALGALLGAQRVATRGERMCRGAEDKLAGVWERAADSPRRSAVHRGMLNTGSALAAGTWTRVAALLDDYAANWSAAYTDTCEATHVRGDQSDEVLDLRMNCLEGARGSLRALTDVLTTADDRAVIEAVNAAHALPALERCADVVALRSVVPPPTDPIVRSRVAEIEVRLSQVKALRDTGNWTEARRQVAPLVDSARATAYEPLLAEALALQAWLEIQLGDTAAARTSQEESVWVALVAHRDDIAAESAAEMLGLADLLAGSQREVERWDNLAQALIRRLGPGHERIAGWYHQNRGNRFYGHGELHKAEAEFSIALSLKQSSLPRGHPDIARTLASIANVRADESDGVSALSKAKEAFDIVRSAYGERSPFLAVFNATLGLALETLGRYGEAEGKLRLAMASADASFATEGPFLADRLTEFGRILVAERKYREAAPILGRALRLEQGVPALVVDRAESEFALARANWALDRNRPAAVRMALAAREIYRPMPDCRSRVLEITSWLADTASPPSDVAP